MPKPLARAARGDVMTSGPRPRTIGCAPLADVPTTDKRWCPNPNVVPEVDPCTRAVRIPRSDVAPGALEGVHIGWHHPCAVSVGLKSRKSDAGRLWDDILTLARRARPTEQIVSPIRALFLVMKEIQGGGAAAHRLVRPVPSVREQPRGGSDLMHEVGDADRLLWSVDRAEGKLSATAVEHVEHRGPTEGRAHGC